MVYAGTKNFVYVAAWLLSIYTVRPLGDRLHTSLHELVIEDTSLLPVQSEAHCKHRDGILFFQKEVQRKTEQVPKEPISMNARLQLPGDLDTHGPDAAGQKSPLPQPLKLAIVAILFALSASPAIVALYFSVSSEISVTEDGQFFKSIAAQRLIDMIYKCGCVGFRVGMFIIYFWFGILKVIGMSPAEPLVQVVFRELPFSELASADLFCRYAVGLGECGLALMYLLTLAPSPRVRFWSTVAALSLGLGHIVSVSLLPAILLPHEVWQKNSFPYALTFEGQYIVKNLILVAGLMMMARDLSHLYHD